MAVALLFLAPMGRALPAPADGRPFPARETDAYGGAKAIPGRATGWFHVERLRGRWFFVTPEGHAYIPIGVNHLASYLGLGDFDPAFFDELYRRTGRPIINVDHVGNFPTPATPAVMGRALPDEAAAAAQYARYLQAAFARPYMLGYSRCQLASRRQRGQNATGWKQGIIAPDGEPYPLLLQAMVATNNEVLGRLYQQ
jgi:hypothetical protein